METKRSKKNKKKITKAGKKPKYRREIKKEGNILKGKIRIKTGQEERKEFKNID